MNELTSALVIAVLAASVTAQDILHYKFESGGGDQVINYATGADAAEREATVIGKTSPWTKGKFGGGLGGRLDTGWKFEVLGDYTLSFFMRSVAAIPASSANKILGGSGNSQDTFWMSMSGVSSRKGWLSVGTGSGGGVAIQRDMWAMAYKDWVHIAVVVRTTNGRGTVRWFVNGKAELPQAVSGWYPIRCSKSTLQFSDYTPTVAFDECRLTLRAASAKEILAWATVRPAAHAPFGNPCHPLGRNVLLDGRSGGLPTIGNAGYTLTVYGLPQSSVALALGGSNQTYNGGKLPMDLKALDPKLTGCLLRTSADILVFGAIGPTGALPFSLPIPNIPALSGAKLYSQAVLSSKILNTPMLTNAYATVVGK